MYLKSLLLKNFRVYTERQFEFSPGINLIEGPNAQGKTTILEAIHLMICGSSFRSNSLGELIREGEKAFYLEAVFEKHGIEQTLKFSYNGRQKSIKCNHTICRTTAELLGILQGTLMLPDDIQLVKGPPKWRRQFLDLQLAQIDPLYVHHLTRYHRSMRQRNALLKKKSIASIEIFEEEMSRSAAYLIHKRHEAVNAVAAECQEGQKALSEGVESLVIQYQPRYRTQVELLEQMQKMRPRDLKFGSSLTGPHRDDLLFVLNGQPAHAYASEGQKKTLAAALRFAEWHNLKRCSESDPLMLIDDVGVSLDKNRRTKLMSRLVSMRQVFVTSTEPLEAKDANIILLFKI